MLGNDDFHSGMSSSLVHFVLPASYVCRHHQHLPLYGGGAADNFACAAMLGASVVTGIGRVITEEHHVSDLVVGYAAGLFAGFAMPELLHYGSKSPAAVAASEHARAPTVRMTLLPEISQRELGLGVRGLF